MFNKIVLALALTSVASAGAADRRDYTDAPASQTVKVDVPQTLKVDNPAPTAVVDKPQSIKLGDPVSSAESLSAFLDTLQSIKFCHPISFTPS